jgi:hypothetical protein
MRGAITFIAGTCCQQRAKCCGGTGELHFAMASSASHPTPCTLPKTNRITAHTAHNQLDNRLRLTPVCAGYTTSRR